MAKKTQKRRQKAERETDRQKKLLAIRNTAHRQVAFGHLAQDPEAPVNQIPPPPPIPEKATGGLLAIFDPDVAKNDIEIDSWDLAPEAAARMVCPRCEELIDGVTGTKKPEEGDVSICTFCFSIGRFREDYSIAPWSLEEMRMMSGGDHDKTVKLINMLKERKGFEISV